MSKAVAMASAGGSAVGCWADSCLSSVHWGMTMGGQVQPAAPVAGPLKRVDDRFVSICLWGSFSWWRVPISPPCLDYLLAVMTCLAAPDCCSLWMRGSHRFPSSVPVPPSWSSNSSPGPKAELYPHPLLSLLEDWLQHHGWGSGFMWPLS